MEVFIFYRNQLPRVLCGVSKLKLTRVNEGSKCYFFLAITMEARTVVGRGEKSLLEWPRINYEVGREKDKVKLQIQ